MGAEIVPFLIWFLGAAGIFIVVSRMILTRRWLAAAVAFVLSVAAYLPLCFIFGKGMFPILHAELGLGLIIGIPALAYSKRWSLLLICLAVALAPVVAGLLPAFGLPPVRLEGIVLKFLAVPVFVWLFTVLSGPVCITLASVFFVGAFIERRPSAIQADLPISCL
jgi:hypothetical protein